MKEQAERDLERFATIVREYHRTGPSTARAFCDASDTLQDEIGEERMQAAREEYDERQFRQAEAREDRWIEDHYR